jgi:hypothetical protein
MRRRDAIATLTLAAYRWQFALAPDFFTQISAFHWREWANSGRILADFRKPDRNRKGQFIRGLKSLQPNACIVLAGKELHRREMLRESSISAAWKVGAREAKFIANECSEFFGFRGVKTFYEPSSLWRVPSRSTHSSKS